MLSTDILSFILAFVIFYFSLSFLSRLRQKEVFQSKIKDLMKYKERLILEESKEKKIYKSPEDQWLPWLTNFIDKVQISGKKEQETIRKLFIKAGFKPQNASLIYGISKILFAFLPSIIVGLALYEFSEWIFLYKAMFTIAIALLGSYLVDIILDHFVRVRQARIRKAFPEALDLMVICTEAGLSLTSTVQRVAREISQVSPDLGYELALLSIELNIFSDRKRALQNFSDRLDSPYFKAIISNIIQAEQYGTPIAQTMRVISEQFRQDRLVEAEEKAAKLPVLMSLPMMLFIFPCIYIVILGPAMIKVLEAI